MTSRTFLTFICLWISCSLFSQSDEDLIRHTIHNYFNGTAYNHLDQIRMAFYPEATLYLENREGELMKMTPEEYIALFKKNEPGKFGGRYSKILSIDIEGTLALVKAEILFPGRKRRYIDVFIVREMEEQQWRIISKSANSAPMEEE